MSTKKIVIIGGPSTGKTSLIKHLQKKGFSCFEEVSREIIREAKQKGIDQLFLSDPLLFSDRLLQGRITQFQTANKTNKKQVFFDRGIPDILAYLEYIKTPYPERFSEACMQFRYDKLFILPPWKEIYTNDGERYENFEQSVKIYEQLIETYKKFRYELCIVPLDTIEKRTEFILNQL